MAVTPARRALLLAAAALAVLAGSVRAEAAPGMLIGIFDDGQTLFNGQSAFATYQRLRVQIVRIQLVWGGPRGVALRRPANPADPADPAYDWTIYDKAVLRAQAAGMQVLFSIWGTPSWANPAGPNHAPLRSADLRAFAAAAAIRYSGKFALQQQLVLPTVTLWAAWNEPNNPVFLKPQFVRSNGKWVYQAARDYAKICEAVWSGIHSTPLREKVACGVTAPRGNNSPTSERPSTSPLAFLRAAKSAGLKHFDDWAHHPYYGSKLETPSSVPPHGANGTPANSVTLGNLDTLVGELTRLYGPKRVWITEYGYQTDPPDPLFGVSWAKQASYLKDAFAIARKNPRVDMMIWYLLQDEPAVSGWQSGLRTTGGRLKPSFKAFQQLPR